TAALSAEWFTCQPAGPVKHLDVVVPTRLLEDVGILTELFFHNNESVDVLQSFAVRPHVLAFVVRVRRRGPFKDLEAIRREARALVRRYRLARFELMSASRERGEYLAWIEWKIPEAFDSATTRPRRRFRSTVSANSSEFPGLRSQNTCGVRSERSSEPWWARRADAHSGGVEVLYSFRASFAFGRSSVLPHFRQRVARIAFLA